MEHQSRRSFLKRIGQVGLASIAARTAIARSSPQSGAPTPPALTTRPDTDPIAASVKSLVAHVRRPEVVDRRNIHAPLMREMIEDGIRVVTNASTPADAWNRLFTPDDVIGVKFNQVGFEELDTNDILARQLVESLGDAGFAPDRIVLIEVPAGLARQLKTKPCPFGWSGEEVSFSSGAEQLAAVLGEVTALVNVPFLKTHNIAGMTGCLKNLSHALIRRPGRYHADACTPFVGDIVALPQIKNKLRINIVNAIRALYAGGPTVKTEWIWNHAGLICSTDPVAADAVGIEIINDQRVWAHLPPVGNKLGQIPHVHDAADKGLGTDDQDYIDLKEVTPW